MPTSQEPVNEPTGPTETSPEPRVAVPDTSEREQADESATPAALRSRWVDYDTHELLTMISELEDERRFARLREGIWLAILLHIALLSALTWIPRYVFKVPPVIDPFDAIKQRKDLTYLDLPPDALRKYQQPKVVVKPLQQKPLIDKKTLEEMNKPTPPAPAPEPTPAPQTATPPAPVPPAAQTPSQAEAPRPQAVPARPNFAMNSANPNDLLHEAMKGAARNSGQNNTAPTGSGGLSRHPGAGDGGIQILSDTQGVDFRNWLQKWHYETMHTWDPLIPDEVNAPILKKGQVLIRFKVLPNGRLMEGSVIMEGRSGDVGLDRAAWGALTGSNYPPLPKEFHGPYLELRALFMYNMQPD